MIVERKPVEAVREEHSAPARSALPRIPDIDERSPAEFFWTLFQARVLISVVTVAFVVLGGLYIGIKMPVYRSNVVLQVEPSTKSIAGLSELSALLSENTPADTEMEILRSRTLLGAVVDQLNLQIEVAPKRFPILGSLARRYRGSTPAKPMLGLTSYSWGGDRLEVERFDVPDAALNQRFELIARGGGGYELRSHGKRVLTGEVGKAAAGGEGDSRLAIFVSDLVARPGTTFYVEKHSRLGVVRELEESLRITEKGRKTGIILVELEGHDPREAAAILDAVASTYVRQNVELKSAEASKTLAFLESQLPTLKANLDAAETSLKSYQVEKGTNDLTAQATSLMDRSVEIEKALSEAELQRSDLRQRFTDSHPALIALNEKIEKLRADRGAMEAKMRELPGNELESARLTRDVKVSSELYNVLLNKAQELKVVKSGTIGNVRIVDRASVPEGPVAPNTKLVLSLSLLLGLSVGVAAAFTRKSLYTGLDDPEMVEQVTGMTVYATVPRSTRQVGINRASGRQKLLLAAADPGDPAVEAMRSLRTGLQFALLEAKNNIVVITGPTAGVGKSFVTANLAHVMAVAGRRVLIIDTDLRRGRIHKFFGGERYPGLSDVLLGTALLADAVRESPMEKNLHWLPTGRLPPDPAEVLGSDRFERVLIEIAARYDLVIVDTAPILAVTDPTLVSRHAGTTLLVLRAGAHPVREIVMSVKRLAHSGIRVQGAIMNDVSGAGARYSKYSYQYRYDSRA